MKKNKETTEVVEEVVATEQDTTEIDRLTLENSALNDKLLRMQAEMMNSKRRNDETISNLLKYEGADFIKKIIEVNDMFERAIMQDDAELDDEVSKFLSGFKMIYAKFSNILSDYEVSEIDCLHKPFDPNTMEGVMTEACADYESNTVIDVMQKGYIYKDKVIRHAMVKVAE